MPCSATAALQDKIMTDRDETPQEREELRALVLERAKKIAGSDSFAWEAIAEIDGSYFEAIGELSIADAEDIIAQAAVGMNILRAIRDAAIKQAEQELGW